MNIITTTLAILAIAFLAIVGLYHAGYIGPTGTIIYAANSAPVETLDIMAAHPADLGPNNKSNVIYAANESRFGATYLSQPLSDFATGVKPRANVTERLNKIIPTVNVSRRFEFKKMGANDHFVTEADDSDVRAIGAAFKRVDYAGSKTDSSTLNKGLTIRIDHDDEMQGSGWQERYVEILLNRLMLRELNRAVALLDAHKVDAGVTWNPAADPLVNPLQGLRAQMEAVADATGVYPNKVALGSTAAQYFYDLIEAHENNRISNIQTLAQLGAMLSDTSGEPVDVFSVNVRYVNQKAEVGKKKVIGTPIFFYRAEEIASKDDASNIKRFVSSTQSGAPYGVYVEEHPKFTDITVEHYSREVATSTTGIRKLTVANS